MQPEEKQEYVRRVAAFIRDVNDERRPKPLPGYVPTSIAKNMLSRMNVVHDRRRIAVFSGPPGIGKSTAIRAFALEHRGAVAVITVKKEKATPRLVMQHVVEAVRELSGVNMGRYIYLETFQVARQLQEELDILARGDPEPKITLVFDEAQTLSRAAIEELRHWNDAAGSIRFPLGIVFVGNQEFSLAADANGQSVISAAVADRARFIESFDYADLSNDDLSMFIRSRGIEDEDAVKGILRHYGFPRAIRSFRRVADLIDDLIIEADGAPVTATTVKTVLNPV